MCNHSGRGARPVLMACRWELPLKPQHFCDSGKIGTKVPPSLFKRAAVEGTTQNTLSLGGFLGFVSVWFGFGKGAILHRCCFQSGKMERHPAQQASEPHKHKGLSIFQVCDLDSGFYVCFLSQQVWSHLNLCENTTQIPQPDAISSVYTW